VRDKAGDREVVLTRPKEGTPSPAKAKELAVDVMTRSITIKMMLSGSQGLAMRAMMGLPGMDFGDELRGKANDLVESLDAWEKK
jgi:hypothetical protein